MTTMLEALAEHEKAMEELRRVLIELFSWRDPDGDTIGMTLESDELDRLAHALRRAGIAREKERR
jgi:hypothetical protein